MNDKIEIIDREVGNVVEIERTVSMMKMPKIMGQDYKAIFKYLGENDIEQSIKTMPYTRYLDIDWESQMKKSGFANFIEIFTKKWHFQDGVQSPTKLESSGEFVSSKFNKKKYLRAMHYGPYQKVSDTYRKMWNYAQEQNIKLAGESIEFYLNDPTTVTKDKIETEVLIEIVD